MSRLILKYEGAVLNEIALGAAPVTIGRGPDNDVTIDNLAVSTYHARVYPDAGSYLVEDMNSLNGTFLNDIRVQRAMLKDGDAILIGKHHLVVEHTPDAALAEDSGRKTRAPRLDETMVLDTRERRAMLDQAAAAGERSQMAPNRARIPTLVVLHGRTSKREYRLAGKLTVIGRSPMATVRLRSWFTPDVAAQINKHEDGYYLGRGVRAPKINGVEIGGLTKLQEGDVIEVGRVRLNFLYRE